MKRPKDIESTGRSQGQKLPNISYQTLGLRPGTKNTGVVCAKTFCAVRKPKAVKPTISPISNIPVVNPGVSSDDSVLPTVEQLENYRLRNEVALLQQRQKTLLVKLNRALETILSEERFFEVGLKYDQWETYDELTRRRLRLRAVRDLICDFNAEPQASQDELEQLRQKLLKG